MQNKITSLVKSCIHILEYVIAVMTLVVLLVMLGFEIFKMFTTPDYFLTANTYLHNVLTIVVGLEFVRMLINLTPANTLEVLTVAIARQVIVNHEGVLSNIVCVLCIGGLFAIRRYLIPKPEYKVELAEDAEDEKEAEKVA